mmetsp:Transcript_22258/g.25568  ORF Transcript_22258/g.25568 Transcript_22258/m.25568 type:complete len:209 (-) Transcript_22258:1350-1976(-)
MTNSISERAFFAGSDGGSTYLYIASVPYNQIDLHPDFTAVTYTATSSTTSSFLQSVASPILTQNSVTMSTPMTAAAAPALVLIGGASTKSDASYNLNAQHISNCVRDKYYEEPLALTCTLPASAATVAYSLVAYEGQSPPSWVTLDAATGKLKFTAPGVTSPTQFKFGVSSQVSTDSVSTVKPVFITVFCVVEHCDECQPALSGNCKT